MTDEPENLTLRYLRRIDAKIDGLAEVQRDHGYRLTRIEAGMASLRRDQASDAESVAFSATRVDRLNERVERIERRLELSEAPAPGFEA
jgi:hypothetical protein